LNLPQVSDNLRLSNSLLLKRGQDMCCSAARLFAAFVTFTIGTLVAVPFLNQPTKIPVKVKNYDGYICTTFKLDKEVSKKVNSSEKPITCTDKNLLLVRDELAEELVEIVDNSKSNCTDYLTAETIDLNKDGQKEVIITGRSYPFCASGGCQFWIFDTSKGTKQLLNDAGNVEIQKNGNKGFRNIKSAFRFSSNEYSYTLFKFDGKSYKASKCWNENYLVKGRNDEVRVQTTPKIKRTQCTN
jgi:hypothetical protein